MKAKLLRRIRKNWFIGIHKDSKTSIETYICASKKTKECHHWLMRHKYTFYYCITEKCGFFIDRSRYIEKWELKRTSDYYNELLNKIRQ